MIKKALTKFLSEHYYTVSELMSSYYFMFHSDPHTLVELMNFSALGKMQPFSVDISTNCLLLMVSVSTFSRLPKTDIEFV